MALPAGLPALRRVAWALLALAVLCVVAAGCSRRPGRDLQPGSYRAVLQLPGERELAFALDVAREERGPVLYLVNGEERIRIAEVQASPGRVAAAFPGYESRLAAEVSGGTLRGSITLVHGNGRRLELPFAARLGQTWQFFEQPLADNADLAGLWEVTLKDARGRTTRAVADLQQRFERVTGTLVAATGDMGWMAGEVHDQDLKLARFDGGAAVLVEAKLDAAGRLVGDLWTDRSGLQRFVATRNPDATVDGAPVATRVRDPARPLVFDFRGLDGSSLNSADPTLRGKVLLLSLGGSWCPNSHDEAVLLARLDRTYRSRGLAVVGLMFEQHAEFERAAAAVRRFRDATGVEYPTLIAGGMERSNAARLVPVLDDVRAYPTTLFVDRSGHVRRVHAGFFGPAAGVRHARLVQEYESTVEALLAEPAPSADGGIAAQ